MATKKELIEICKICGLPNKTKFKDKLGNSVHRKCYYKSLKNDEDGFFEHWAKIIMNANK